MLRICGWTAVCLTMLRICERSADMGYPDVAPMGLPGCRSYGAVQMPPKGKLWVERSETPP